MSKNSKTKEEQNCASEKPKIDNARRLRGSYFIDPEDTEFKETIKNARKKLKTPMAPDVLAHNFARKLCCGSKKWRWLIQWMI